MSRIASQISVFLESEVKETMRKAKRVLRHPGLDILVRKSSENYDFGRILVITSRKVGPAVKRNLIRRRLKAIFYQEELYKNRFDYICIIKKEGIGLNFSQLKEILLNIKLPTSDFVQSNTQKNNTQASNTQENNTQESNTQYSNTQASNSQTKN